MSSKIVLPSYTTKIPSTGKSVQYRPFTVKEEKSLLLALQEDNIENLSNAIKNVIYVCTDGKVDPESVPYYDVEFLFLQIRSKSIGEIIDLVGTCDCGPNKKTEFSVDIADVKVEPIPVETITIQIPDTSYTIEFKHPCIDDFVKNFSTDGQESAQIVARCIVKVYTDDEVMDWSFEEKLDFVESMTSLQQKGIGNFLKNMPMVKLPTTYTCRHCKKVHENTLSGFENFFV